MSASYVRRTQSTKNYIHVKMESVTIHQETIYASAGWEQDNMIKILDADLCLTGLDRWS
jgi:hypothetical protein